MPKNIITLTNENGDDVNYEFLDFIEYEGENYVAVDNDELLNTTFSIFKEKNKDNLNFAN